MNDKGFVLDTMRCAGQSVTKAVQEQSEVMIVTELNAELDYIPDFQVTKATKNMLTRKTGKTDGFVCCSMAGRVVRLIQNYGSETYPQEPKELPAQWRFVRSTDPKKSSPFIEIATSPYANGDCCTYKGHVWRSMGIWYGWREVGGSRSGLSDEYV